MYQKRATIFVLILLCIVLPILSTIEFDPPPPAVMGLTSPGVPSGAKETVIIPSVIFADINGTPWCENQSGSAYPAEGPVCISSIERLTTPAPDQYSGIRVWCTNTQEEEVQVRVILSSNGEQIGNASLCLGANETGAVDFISFISSASVPTSVSILLEEGSGAESNPTDNPIGGGDGYTDIISRDDPRVKFIVDTRDELLSALKNARAGDVIYVEGDAKIDMSGYFDVAVPGGVTIASNRGENGALGGRIFQVRLANEQDSDYIPMFRTFGSDVRFTGLRIEGPDRTQDAPARIRCAIHNIYPMEVDNCEISGWSYAGIETCRAGRASDMKGGGYFHHNYIHHCQAAEGYGIVVTDGAVCLIEANYFDYCRHAIAGDGRPGSGYEARYNICGPNFTANYAFQFDMHGKPNPSGPGMIAGDTIKIHHNTFMATGPLYSFPICIRGVPTTGAYIDHNWFYYTMDAPVWQTDGQEKIFVTENHIGPDRAFSPSGPIKYY